MKSALLFTTLLVLSSYRTISQTGIPEPDVKLKRTIAIAAVKDLERYDGLKTQYQLLQQKVEEMNKVIAVKDASIQAAKDNEGRLNTVIGNYQVLNDAQENRYADMEKKYKRQVRLGRFQLVLIGGSVAFALYETLKK